jgi:hypothetical protein
MQLNKNSSAHAGIPAEIPRAIENLWNLIGSDEQTAALLLDAPGPEAARFCE